MIFKIVSDGERMTTEHYCAIRSDGLSYAVCLQEAAGTVELVREFDRLYGARLVSRTTPIEQMVDEATGKLDDDMQAFLRFVWNFIFLRTPEIKERK
jgi:hypothetical protein